MDRKRWEEIKRNLEILSTNDIMEDMISEIEENLCLTVEGDLLKMRRRQKEGRTREMIDEKVMKAFDRIINVSVGVVGDDCKDDLILIAKELGMEESAIQTKFPNLYEREIDNVSVEDFKEEEENEPERDEEYEDELDEEEKEK